MIIIKLKEEEEEEEEDRKKEEEVVREMAQQLVKNTFYLPKDPSSIPGTHSCLKSSSRASSGLRGHPYP